MVVEEAVVDVGGIFLKEGSGGSPADEGGWEEEGSALSASSTAGSSSESSSAIVMIASTGSALLSVREWAATSTVRKEAMPYESREHAARARWSVSRSA